MADPQNPTIFFEITPEISPLPSSVSNSLNENYSILEPGIGYTVNDFAHGESRSWSLNNTADLVDLYATFNAVFAGAIKGDNNLVINGTLVTAENQKSFTHYMDEMNVEIEGLYQNLSKEPGYIPNALEGLGYSDLLKPDGGKSSLESKPDNGSRLDLQTPSLKSLSF
ncbi:MAG: hypothetical protein K9G62_06850 [Alphaproteobacteria bacterium]|nr:hypothetical protein [Alphaproteobacteria bacterium]